MKISPEDLQQLLSSLGNLIVRILILSFALAYLLAFVEGLRTMGIQPFYFPFSLLGQFQPRIINPAIASSPFLKGFDDFIFLFNCTFPGASRMGSGIGMIFASFWTLHETDPSNKLQRLVIGIVAGAIIGFRLTLMISNSAVLILAATIIYSIGFAIYMSVAGRKAEIPRIPLVDSGSG